MITKLSATHCPHTNMFMLFKLLYHSYELTVKITKAMAFNMVFILCLSFICSQVGLVVINKYK